MFVVVSPITQSNTIAQISRSHTPQSWETVFKNAEVILDDISDTLEKHRPWYPLVADVFRAFDLTPLHRVRVVIVGQDPYPSAVTIDGKLLPRATGCSFSVRYGDDIPPSLRNIQKEIASNIPGYSIPTHGNLDNWALQGILLLNRALTVQPSVPKSHIAPWKPFVKMVIQAVCSFNPRVIFLLWGREAQEVREYIGSNVTVLEAAHPSTRNLRGGFIGCGHFSRVNELLLELHQEPILW
jgi:uracil-DNA glycosylase